MPNRYRAVAPRVSKNYTIQYPEVTIIKAKNGIPVHVIKAGTKNVMKLDVVFKAGTRITDPLIPKATADLMVEATQTYHSEKLSNIIDTNGAFLFSEADRDRVSISMVVIEKFFDNLIHPLYETIHKPKFDTVDFNRYRIKRRQQHIHALESTSTIASRAFGSQLYGKEHPYGRMANVHDYDNLDLDKIRDFHRKHYINDGTYAVVAGQFPDSNFDKVMEVIGSIPNGSNTDKNDYTPQPEEPKLNRITKKDAKQATIRVGDFCINKAHPDYATLRIANTILGGYFGSRLMQVIREQKGYTYGIGSNLISLEHGAYWSISGDVLLDKVDEVLADIRSEIELLKIKPIAQSELEMIQNYMMGEILQNFDGPFAIADTYKVLTDYGLDFTYFENLKEAIQLITSDKLCSTVQQYFNYDSAIKTVVSCE